jgi:hypothetical protein
MPANAGSSAHGQQGFLRFSMRRGTPRHMLLRFFNHPFERWPKVWIQSQPSESIKEEEGCLQ